MKRKDEKALNIGDGKVFSGFIFGLLFGSLVAIFQGPRLRLGGVRENLSSTGKDLYDKLETTTADAGKMIRAIASDPINDSIAEGKEAARRRRTELGLG